MRGIKLAGLCLVAVFVFGAVSAASASAENAPMFIKCVKTKKVGGKYTGTYTNKTCTVKATEAQIEQGKKNKYALEELPEEEHGLHFATKGKAVTITTKGVEGNAQVIVCAASRVSGELYDTYGSGKLAGTFSFEKCVGNKSAADKCGNAGPETIKYTPIFGETHWIEAGEVKPGLVLLGGVEFVCGSEEVEVEGILIGTIENTSKGVTFAFKTNAGGEQEDHDFWLEGEEVTEFGLTHWYTEGEAETTVKGSEALKVKGVSAHKV